jgi:hypothetical protein
MKTVAETWGSWRKTWSGDYAEIVSGETTPSKPSKPRDPRFRIDDTEVLQHHGVGMIEVNAPLPVPGYTNHIEPRTQPDLRASTPRTSPS